MTGIYFENWLQHWFGGRFRECFGEAKSAHELLIQLHVQFTTKA